MSSSDLAGPVKIVKSFLAGIKSRDKDSMRSVCHADATACLIRNGKPLHLPLSKVLDLIPEDGNEDEVSYDEVTHFYGDFATVWTPYKYYEDGKVSFKCNQFLERDGRRLLKAVKEIKETISIVCTSEIVLTVRKIHHQGANSFSLWKSPEQGWVITSVQDIAISGDGVTPMQVIGSRDNKSI